MLSIMTPPLMLEKSGKKKIEIELNEHHPRESWHSIRLTLPFESQKHSIEIFRSALGINSYVGNILTVNLYADYLVGSSYRTLLISTAMTLLEDSLSKRMTVSLGC
jgi:hypothetical protein